MKFQCTLLLLPLLCAAPLFVGANDKPLAIDTSQRYLVLDTIRVKTLQGELDQASAAGYRVAFGDASHNILILEKGLDRYQYRVLQGLKDEFKTAVADAFCAVPNSFSSDYMKARALIMEKPVGTSKIHDYLLLDTVRTKTLQKELNEGAMKGYELAAISTYGAKNVLMEKTSPDAPPATDRYLLLATTRTSTMQKELNEAVARGYEVIAGSGGDEVLIIMEKAAKPSEYLLLATARTTTLEKEINEAAARGFRPLPRTLLGITRKHSMLGMNLTPDETVVIMEKVAQPEFFVYKIIGTSRVGTFKKELAEAAGEGFQMIGFTLTFTEQVGLLRRAGAPPQKPQN